MHKPHVFALAITLFVAVFVNVQMSYAVSSNLVISQIQTRSLVGSSASEELIEAYNNSDIDVDITNWCLKYGSAGVVKSTKTLACFEHSSPAVGNYVFLPKRSAVLLVSKIFADQYPKFSYDVSFSSGMSDSERWLTLTDSSEAVVDMVEWGWGTQNISTTAEGGMAAPAPTSTQLIQRKIVRPGELQDTDSNFNDFEPSLPRNVYSPGLIYELEDVCLNIDDIQTVIPDGYTVDAGRKCSPPPVDVCSNLDGLQVTVPTGYELIDGGQCQMDICMNLEGLQLSIPVGMELDSNSDCVGRDECFNLPGIQAEIPGGYIVDDVRSCSLPPVDVCNNLDGLQQNIPDGYKNDTKNNCVFDLLPLKLSELLPNAVGSDTGHEYIEIYNPNGSDVDLSNYVLYVGLDDTHQFDFPAGSRIGAGQYVAFSNDDIKFTLVNMTSRARLYSADGVLIDETPIYTNPGDGLAWALINGAWHYTNQPTIGSANLESLVVAKVEKPATTVTSSLQPCAANQYRSTETNRCRLIVATTSTVAPCKDGQYRSEQTNRCRSIVSDVVALTPCAEGQERNPETNRCRSVATVLGAGDLAPCKAGQERNPETNRCRNVISSIPQVGYAPVLAAVEPTNNYIGWWSLAGVGALAVIYGVWEWRQEIVGLAIKFGKLLNFNK